MRDVSLPFPWVCFHLTFGIFNLTLSQVALL
jgi:hypothetical protein